MIKNSGLILPISIAALISMGLVMLFSTGAYAHDAHGDTYYFLKRQAVWLSIGVAICIAAAFIDYHVWAKLWMPLFATAACLLAMCFLPHIGLRLNGSSRWIRLGPLVFQPSEVAKFAVVVALSAWFNRCENESSSLRQGFLKPISLISVIMLLIVREEDLGTTLLVGMVMIAIMFVAGSNLWYMLALALAVTMGILLLAFHMSERMGRLEAFMHLENYKGGKGLQQWESLKAFGSGGVYGVGLGESTEKMQYLPYAHTDFIFPIVGEELGLRATLLVVFAFLIATLSGISIALQSKDRFGMLLGIGLTVTISFQATVNIGMTTAILPNKGMPLPFISSGGSNLCLCLLFVGILLNIYRQGCNTTVEQIAHVHALRGRITPRV